MIDKKLHKSQLKAEYLTNFYERNLLKKYAADTVDSVNEECGVFGVWGAKNANYLTYLGLHSLQHRGQEGAGQRHDAGHVDPVDRIPPLFLPNGRRPTW